MFNVIFKCESVSCMCVCGVTVVKKSRVCGQDDDWTNTIRLYVTLFKK